MCNPDVLGWLAAGLMLATFGCRDACAMRPLAVATHLDFIGDGAVAALAPVLALHLLLLPIDLWRWAEVRRRHGCLPQPAPPLMGALARRCPERAPLPVDPHRRAPSVRPRQECLR